MSKKDMEKPVDLQALSTDEIFDISERESVIKVTEFLQGAEVTPDHLKTALQQEGKKIARDGRKLHECVVKLQVIKTVCRSDPDRFYNAVTTLIPELKGLPPAKVA
jgi:hypothetical protein